MKMKIYPYTPGTLPDRTVHIMINDRLEMTSFCDQAGKLIGTTMVTDTTFHYWHCTQWQEDVCLSWIEVFTPEEADSTSMEIFEHAAVDTSLTHFQYGTMRVVPLCHGLCGDANNDGRLNVGDGVFIITYIFRGGPPPYEDKCADANNDYRLTAGDAIYLINCLFRSGDCPDCSPH
jgi:hypothetical protein